jgi:hypothetical protein
MANIARGSGLSNSFLLFFQENLALAEWPLLARKMGDSKHLSISKAGGLPRAMRIGVFSCSCENLGRFRIVDLHNY